MSTWSSSTVLSQTRSSNFSSFSPLKSWCWRVSLRSLDNLVCGYLCCQISLSTSDLTIRKKRSMMAKGAPAAGHPSVQSLVAKDCSDILSVNIFFVVVTIQLLSFCDLITLTWHSFYSDRLSMFIYTVLNSNHPKLLPHIFYFDVVMGVLG